MKALLLIGLLMAITTFCACMWVNRALEKSQLATRDSQIEEAAR